MSLSTKSRLVFTKPNSTFSEVYKSLRTNITFAGKSEAPQVILVTSACAGEGKSVTAANIAIAYASENKSVLLIDADLRKPTLHHMLARGSRLGLSDILTQQLSLFDAVWETGVPGLSLLTSGLIPENPPELLSSERMKLLLAEVRDQYDIIVIDSPPVLKVADPLILAAQADGVLLVIGYGKTKRKLIRKVRSSLEHVDARIIGAVLNNVPKRSESYSAYYGS